MRVAKDLIWGRDYKKTEEAKKFENCLEIRILWTGDEFWVSRGEKSLATEFLDWMTGWWWPSERKIIGRSVGIGGGKAKDPCSHVGYSMIELSHGCWGRWTGTQSHGSGGTHGAIVITERLGFSGMFLAVCTCWNSWKGLFGFSRLILLMWMCLLEIQL